MYRDGVGLGLGRKAQAKSRGGGHNERRRSNEYGWVGWTLGLVGALCADEIKQKHLAFTCLLVAFANAATQLIW
jgi:hypothetical protein